MHAKKQDIDYTNLSKYSFNKLLQ